MVGEVLGMACLATEHGVNLADLLPEHGAVELGVEGNEEGGGCL